MSRSDSILKGQGKMQIIDTTHTHTHTERSHAHAKGNANGITLGIDYKKKINGNCMPTGESLLVPLKTIGI